MRRSLLLAVLVCAGLLLDPAPAPAEPPPAATRLRVLTWNVGTLDPRALRLPEAALPRVADVVAGARPDVVLLQEVAPGQPQRLLAALRARGLAYHSSACVVDPAAPDGLSLVLTRRAPQARLRRRLPMGWGVQGVQLDGVSVLCLHAPSSGPAERARYFSQLSAWTDELPGPMVVAGDFNLGPRRGAGLAAVLPWLRRADVATFARFRAGFQVASEVAPTTVYRLHLDHLLARGVRLEAARRLTGRQLPQDHDPVLCELAVYPARAGFGPALSARQR